MISEVSNEFDTLSFSVNLIKKGSEEDLWSYYSENLFIVYKNKSNKIKKRRLYSLNGYNLFFYPAKYKLTSPFNDNYSFKLIGDIIYSHSAYITDYGSPYIGIKPQGKIETEWIHVKK
jgi:hypothetical protein